MAILFDFILLGKVDIKLTKSGFLLNLWIMIQVLNERKKVIA